MRLLDLFCGAGGAAMGYHRAGFDEIVGVDIVPQPNYPFTFIQGDALQPPVDLSTFDLIHASPPCQAYSRATPHRTRGNHPDLIAPTRELLAAWPYIIENVEFAPLPSAAKVCGSYFGLPIQRHRLFEANFAIWGAPCNHESLPKDIPIFRHGVWYLSRFVNVYGTGGGKARDKWAEAMGIDWMTPTELGQAIPPAYTEFLGRQFLADFGIQRGEVGSVGVVLDSGRQHPTDESQFVGGECHGKPFRLTAPNPTQPAFGVKR